jgi:hypothetical protein
MTAAAAVLWYLAAELTPLKLAGAVERYVLPCAPIWAALAAGLPARWRSPGASAGEATPTGDEGRVWGWGPESIGARHRLASVLAIALLVVPLGHSLLLAVAIADDTRVEAARWLAEHGPEPPYQVVYFGIPSYQLDAARLPGVTLTRLRTVDSQEQRAAIDGAAVLTFSGLDDRRFQDFPRKNAREIGQRNALRAEFPHAVVIQRPFYLKAAFHNPDIELRLR